MKLSDAILKGCKMHPKGKKHYFKNGKSCALGAAYFATCKDPNIKCEDWIEHFWPELLNDRVGRDDDRLEDWITIKNDRKGWSRERIARQLKKWGY